MQRTSQIALDQGGARASGVSSRSMSTKSRTRITEASVRSHEDRGAPNGPMLSWAYVLLHRVRYRRMERIDPTRLLPRREIPFRALLLTDLKELKMSSRGWLQSCDARWRTVAASCAVAAAMLLGASDASAQGRNTVPRSFDVIPITITSVTFENGQLMANGLVGSTPFQTPLTLSPQANPSGECPILNLSLGPIDLTLLGLNVETSRICLDITAQRGGGLLGDLLCGVANLLQGGTPLADVMATLQAQGNEARFLNGLTSVLDQVFDRLSSNSAATAASCNVLNLAIGPLDLNLLGLRVELDDCEGGPVTLDITATPGGGLLGDLLCGLANLLNGGASPLSAAAQRLLFQISQLLGALV
jgi:hypothetical protein